VSCSDATDCTAVGNDDNNEPLYATETTGTWGTFGVFVLTPGGTNVKTTRQNRYTYDTAGCVRPRHGTQPAC
jgi:hypothetical protein